MQILFFFFSGRKIFDYIIFLNFLFHYWHTWSEFILHPITYAISANFHKTYFTKWVIWKKKLLDRVPVQMINDIMSYDNIIIKTENIDLFYIITHFFRMLLFNFPFQKIAQARFFCCDLIL